MQNPLTTPAGPSALPTAPAWWTHAVIARVAAGVAIVIGVLVLVGWTLDVAQLRMLGPAGSASVNPVTAACIGAIGAVMWMLARDEDWKTPAYGLAIVVSVIGVARLYGIATGESIGVDELLFGDGLLQTGDGRTNRMSLNSAVNITLLGLALLLQLRRSRAASAVAQMIAVVVLFTAQAAVIAHAYKSGWFESVGAFNRMALPAAVGFAALAIAVLTISSGEGLIGLILSEGPGGRLARALLPGAFLVPAVLGWLLIYSRRATLLDPDLAETLFVLATILTFVGMVTWIASQLQQSHQERLRQAQALSESETRFRLIAENSSDVICLYDTAGRIIYASPSCERVFGFLPDEMTRMTPFATVHQQDIERLVRHFNQLLRGDPVASIQVRMLHKTGRHLWLEMMWRAVTDDAGQAVQLQVSSRDITESKQNERRLEEAQRKLRQQQEKLQDVNNRLAELASLDALTQLRNRRGFEERLEDEIRRSRRHGYPLSLMLLDIDHFKLFNDTFGHPRGDEVLRNVGRCIRRSVRATDVAARYGGEEFAVILPNTDRSGAVVAAEHLRAAIEEATWVDRQITASIGVATYSNEVNSADALLDHADRALYQSKQAGRNRVTQSEVRAERREPATRAVETDRRS
jgi:diguanylate cyclase (GGDEF)-like protein/PAS domain S-box-containing protein